VQKSASPHFISPGKWRVVTPAGIARVRRPHRVVFSRRLRPCPRKASTRSDPGRREMHVLIAKNPAVTSQFISTTIKSNKNYEKILLKKQKYNRCNMKKDR